jgi:hypothetical protein
MKSLKRNIVFILMLATFFRTGILEGKSKKQTDSIVVGISNIVGMPESVLEQAEKVASTVLEDSGIIANWVACPKPGEKMTDYPSCPQSIGINRVLVKMGHPFERKDGFKESNFGFAVGAQVIIVFAQVDQAAREAQIHTASALGMIMAHEIGHILLGDNSHSKSGIMRPQWNPKEFVKGSPAYCQFTSEQTGKIHATLKKEAAETETAHARLGH